MAEKSPCFVSALTKPSRRKAMTAPAVLPNETCEDYCERAHRYLLPTIAEPAHRNEVIWSAWDASRGNSERYRARSHFDEQNYSFQPNVCHFAEHTATTRDGEVRHGVQELKSLCQNLNLRIRDVDAFPALIDRHTVDRPSAHDPEPIVLGYAGPFRLGMIGREEPRFAIFGDEHYKLNKLPDIASKPRRSVELIRFRSGGRSYFDPIACLGAESPRLPMPPAFYSAHGTVLEENAELCRYSIASPVYAGATNSFIPVGDDDRLNYAADESPQLEIEQAPSDHSETTMLAEDDVRQLIDAILSTPQMAFITQLMQQQQGGGMQPGAGAAPGASPAPSSSPSSPPPSKPAMGDSGPGDNDPSHDPYSSHGDRQYMTQHRYGQDREVIQRYNALATAHNELIRSHGSLKEQVLQLQRERSDAQRRSRLQELESRFPGFVDLEEELPVTLYSAGSTMSDSDFEKHLTQIEKYAAKASPAPMVPRGDAPVSVSDATRERYAAEVANEVVRRCTAMVNQGKVAIYDDVEQEVIRERFGGK